MLLRSIEPGQFTSIRYGERLAEIGAVPSIGSVGDSYDNAARGNRERALQDRTDLRARARRQAGKTVADVEPATLGWVHWHNTQRLHGYTADLPPAEFEAPFYAAQKPTRPWLESNSPSLHQTQGDSPLLALVMNSVRRGDGAGPGHARLRNVRARRDRPCRACS